MKIYLKHNVNTICTLFLKEKLETLKVDYNKIALGEIELNEMVDSARLLFLKEKLEPFGFEIIENHKGILVEKIKEAIIELVFNDKNPNLKISSYLSEKLNHSYGYLSNVFSETTYTSIESFIILQKIERAKQLILFSELNLTEIAYLLNYSSVSHLSMQFKNITGITPSAFYRIIQKRNENLTPSL